MAQLLRQHTALFRLERQGFVQEDHLGMAGFDIKTLDAVGQVGLIIDINRRFLL
ncbi:hypothetical protein D3C76_1497770 [compost metagenome]